MLISYGFSVDFRRNSDYSSGQFHNRFMEWTTLELNFYKGQSNETHLFIAVYCDGLLLLQR